MRTIFILKNIKNARGLTLIEVLIALAIIAIAMTAIIKSTAQTIRATTYLQDKTIAMWVAEDMLNEIRVGLRKLPAPPDKLQIAVPALNHTWYVQADLIATPNENIKEISVAVYAQNPAVTPWPLITLKSYLYEEAA